MNERLSRIMTSFHTFIDNQALSQTQIGQRLITYSHTKCCPSQAKFAHSEVSNTNLLHSSRGRGGLTRWSATVPWLPGRAPPPPPGPRTTRTPYPYSTGTSRAPSSDRAPRAGADGRWASPRCAGSGCWRRCRCSRIRRPRPRPPSRDRPPRSWATPPPRPRRLPPNVTAMSSPARAARAAAAAAARRRARRPRARSPCRSSSGTTPFFSARRSPRRCGAGPRPARRSRCRSSTPVTREAASISDATTRRRTRRSETRRRKTRMRTDPTDPRRRNPRRPRRSRGKRRGLRRVKRTDARASTDTSADPRARWPPPSPTPPARGPRGFPPCRRPPASSSSSPPPGSRRSCDATSRSGRFGCARARVTCSSRWRAPSTRTRTSRTRVTTRSCDSRRSRCRRTRLR